MLRHRGATPRAYFSRAKPRIRGIPATGNSALCTESKHSKPEQDGLDILSDVPKFNKEAADDRDRFKWAGIFYRGQTPGRFMMRIRISNGNSNSARLHARAGIRDD